MNTQNCGMNSSLKFSYWSSPKITMTLGLNSSTAARILRTPAANLSQCLAAALAPSSSPHSACIGGGQFFGSLSRSGTRGLVMDRFTMDIDGPGRYANGGNGLSPTPRISPIRFPSVGCPEPGIGFLNHLFLCPEPYRRTGRVVRGHRDHREDSSKISRRAEARTRPFVSSVAQRRRNMNRQDAFTLALQACALRSGRAGVVFPGDFLCDLCG